MKQYNTNKKKKCREMKNVQTNNMNLSAKININYYY